MPGKLSTSGFCCLTECVSADVKGVVQYEGNKLAASGVVFAYIVPTYRGHGEALFKQDYGRLSFGPESIAVGRPC